MLDHISPTLLFILVAAGILFILWILVNFKTSRPDGTYISKVHRYRRVLWFLMPSANGSAVYCDEYINAEPLLRYLDESKVTSSITQAIVAACAIGLAENPALNKFINGFRMYQRKDIDITFSMKRVKKGKTSGISAVKLRITPDMTIADISKLADRNIKLNRSGEKTYTDKELGLFSLLPRAVFRWIIAVAKQLNYWNLLPGSFMKSDPMFTSMFIANLGSVGMTPGYHHLYEWGNCPIFMMVGEIFERPVAVDGKVVVQKTLHLRYTFDERVDDGMAARDGIRSVTSILENPERDLGCLKDDYSDAWKLTVPRSERTADSLAIPPNDTTTTP